MLHFVVVICLLTMLICKCNEAGYNISQEERFFKFLLTSTVLVGNDWDASWNFSSMNLSAFECRQHISCQWDWSQFTCKLIDYFVLDTKFGQKNCHGFEEISEDLAPSILCVVMRCLWPNQHLNIWISSSGKKWWTQQHSQLMQECFISMPLPVSAAHVLSLYTPKLGFMCVTCMIDGVSQGMKKRVRQFIFNTIVFSHLRKTFRTFFTNTSK